MFMYVVLSRTLESELQTLSTELGDVVQWFSLGVFLGLPPHELERLKQTHGSRKDGLAPMLDLWMKTGPVDYSNLIAALEFCGLSSLAQSLSVKYGKRKRSFDRGISINIAMVWPF